LAESAGEQRFRTVLIGAFAVVGLVLAIGSIAGLLGFAVAGRLASGLLYRTSLGDPLVLALAVARSSRWLSSCRSCRRANLRRSTRPLRFATIDNRHRAVARPLGHLGSRDCVGERVRECRVAHRHHDAAWPLGRKRILFVR